MARSRSLGSATFLFNRALEHHNSGAPTARQQGSTQSGNTTRWGNEMAVCRGFSSPYKLAPDGKQQHELSKKKGCDSPCKNDSAISSTATDTPRDVSSVMRVAPRAVENGPMNRKNLLRPSTWLGPEVSPLQDHRHTGGFNSPSPTASINSAASAWPSPRRNGRWGGGSRGILGYTEANKCGNNISVGSAAGGREHGVRRHKRKGSATCLTLGGGTEVCLESVFEKQALPRREAEANPELSRSLPCHPRRTGKDGVDRRSSATLSSGEGQLGARGGFLERPTKEERPPPQRQKEESPVQTGMVCSACFGKGSVGGEDESATTRKHLYGETGKNASGGLKASLVLCGHQAEGSQEQMRGASRAGPKPMAEWSTSGGRKSVDERSIESADRKALNLEESKKTTGGRSNLNRVPEPTASSQRKRDIACSEGEIDGAVSITCTKPLPPTMVGPPTSSYYDGDSPVKGELDTNGSKDARIGAGSGSLVLEAAARLGQGPPPKTAKPRAIKRPTPEFTGNALEASEAVGVHGHSQLLGGFQTPRYRAEACLPTQSLQQRACASEDRDDRSECTVSEEKLLTLLTRRLKQLVQLESITIQWERLPRREREKLDRQQHMVSSRFRAMERARQESSFPLCMDSHKGRFDAGPDDLNPQIRGEKGTSDGNSISDKSTKNLSLGSHRSISCIVMPPSDAAISSSIDRPRSGPVATGAGAGAGIGVAADIATAHGFKDGLWPSHRAKAGPCGVDSGNGTSRSSISGADKSFQSIATPRAERRRAGREGGNRGRGGSGGELACDVRDTDIPRGLARRGRIGDPTLGIVGTRSTITSVYQFGYRA
ncbi:unnamed protein product [Scytosiphon promiscuus]